VTRRNARHPQRRDVLMPNCRLMAKIVVTHSRKGGVGKSTIAYELAWLLGAPLVDLDWETGGTNTSTWGYRWQDRATAPLLAALEKGRAPRLVTGFRKPDLVPCHPDFEFQQPPPDQMADALSKWAGEWGREWIVVDTHPGATDATNGALSVANVVLIPTALATRDLNGAEATINELIDYPLILVPNKVPPSPPTAEICRIEQLVQNTPIRVGPPIPNALAVGTRKKRIPITAEDPPAWPLRPVAAAMRELAELIKEYVSD